MAKLKETLETRSNRASIGGGMLLIGWLVTQREDLPAPPNNLKTHFWSHFTTGNLISSPRK